MVVNAKVVQARDWMTALIELPVVINAFGKKQEMQAELELSLEDGTLKWLFWHVVKGDQSWMSTEIDMPRTLLDYVLNGRGEKPEFNMQPLNALYLYGGDEDTDPQEAIANAYVEWLAQMLVFRYHVSASTLMEGDTLNTNVRFTSQGGTLSDFDFETPLDSEALQSLKKSIG